MLMRAHCTGYITSAVASRRCSCSMPASLFDPIQYGSITSRNRLVLAPLTRGRATEEGVPTELMQTYYTQRATIGLLISEATGISREGLGLATAPGIWTQQQVDHWRPVTTAVHARGGKIVLQLWHMGRAVHSAITGLQPVSASETTHPTHLHVLAGKRPPEQARALSREDIARVVSEYGRAARNAVAAGFDGVQIHAANGYLLHQFMSDTTNLRTDEYGGSVENRLRILKEVIAAVVEAAGAERTGIRFSPGEEILGVFDTAPEELYAEAAKLVSGYRLAFVELREPTTGPSPRLRETIRAHYKGPLILNQDYTRARALHAVASGEADAVSFGRSTMANPDIVERFEKNLPLRSVPDLVKYFYSPGAEGYTQFPPADQS